MRSGPFNGHVKLLSRDLYRTASAAPSRWARACALLLTVLIFVQATGLPFGSLRFRSSADWYPCMDCPCGCDSAEKCWKSCCCFSDQEKLDWATQNGVKPPDFVLARAKQPAPGVCKTCCSHTKPQAEEKSTVQPNREKLRVVLLLAYQDCQGMEQAWDILSAGLLLPSARGKCWPELLVDNYGWPVDERFRSRRLVPDPPVP